MSKGSPTITIRLPHEILDQIPGIKAAWIRETIQDKLSGTSNAEWKADILFLLEFFNRGGSKFKISDADLQHVKQIYAKVK